MQNKISNLIREFSNNFKSEILLPYSGTENTKIITKIIPEILDRELNLNSRYKVYGSVGKGRWSEIPWFAILDKSITTSTEDGYYIVVLFDKKLENIYLSLAVGWHQFEFEYGIKESKQQIQDICKYYAKVLETQPEGFKGGVIDLGATNILGKGYQLGVITSKKYSINSISDEILIKDIETLLTSYKELKTIVGNSVLNLEIDSTVYNETVKSFKKDVAIKSLSEDSLKSIEELIKIANKKPPEIREVLKKQILRNKKFSDYVKIRDKFICQICGRKPFIQKNGRPYAEADHIKQLGGKEKGLDSPDNMRCLCAQCHAVVTHGIKEEIEKLSKQLL